MCRKIVIKQLIFVVIDAEKEIKQETIQHQNVQEHVCSYVMKYDQHTVNVLYSLLS